MRSHEWIEQGSLALHQAIASIEADVFPRHASKKSILMTARSVSCLPFTKALATPS